MKQLSGLGLFGKMTNDELNNEKEEIVENIDEITTENVSTIDSKESTNDSNGIIEVKYRNDVYRTWSVKRIRPYINKFLKEECPDSILIPEVNLIDITMFKIKFDEIVPIEIQKSPTIKTINGNRFANSHFENSIRKQLEDNIENYGKCWFFIDSEYLRYLQSQNVSHKTSLNLSWLIKLMKEQKLKTFSVKYDGNVKELTSKDFDFLKNISQTCEIGYDNDERILNRNKLKIFRNILIGYNFTQDEINIFYDDFANSIKKDGIIFFRQSDNERCKLYGNALYSIGNLRIINDTLDMNIVEYDKHQHNKLPLVYMGIFEMLKNYNMKFVDKFDICKYFPGYLRQEKHWLTYKGNEMDGKTFLNMCQGFYKNAATIFDL